MSRKKIKTIRSRMLPRRVESSPEKLRRNKRDQRRSAFTLLELMLVVTVLAIVVAMAIPGFISSRKHANETSAISTLRTLSSAELQFHTRYGSYGDVADLSSGGFVTAAFATGEKSGYRFTSSKAPDDITFAIVAEPVSPGNTGDRWFYLDETGVVRYKDGATAGSTDAAIQ